MTDMDKFEMLRQRFDDLEKQMKKAASKWRSDDYVAVANILESNARIYQRCAEELARVIAGEAPPALGEEWERKQEKS